MSDNIVYEISRLMSDREIMKSDINDAAGLVAGMFKKKYIDRLNNKISEHKNLMIKNPPKEVQLINVLKQFMPEENRKMADKAIEAFIMAGTYANLQNELSGSKTITMSGVSEDGVSLNSKTAANQSGLKQDSSIHEDGVYDIDMNCVKRKENNSFTGIMLAMALMMR